MPHPKHVPNAIALLLAIAPLAAGAQSASADSSPRVGQLARFRAEGADAHGRRIACDARIAAIAGDTLVLQPTSRWDACPRQTYATSTVSSLQLARGTHGSRGVHALVGLGVGALALGTLGYAASSCSDGGCSGDGDLRAAFTVFAGTVGGLLGAGIGALLPAGPKWSSAPVRGPVRVVRVNVAVPMRVGGM